MACAPLGSGPSRPCRTPPTTSNSVVRARGALARSERALHLPNVYLDTTCCIHPTAHSHSRSAKRELQVRRAAARVS